MTAPSSRPAEVVVGFDGSPAAEAAVAWAAREADLLGHGLRIVTVVPSSVLASGPYAYPALVDDLEAEAASVGQEARALASRSIDAASVTVEVEVGSPAAVLVGASRRARLVVVGTRGRGGALSALLGSVSLAVTAHARCTVVVVPEADEDRWERGPVVVGVDGSTPADVAVRYAADHAARHGLRVVALAAWDPPTSPGLQEARRRHPGTVWHEGGRREAERHATGAASRVREQHPDLDVEARVVDGPAGQALTTASRSADLLVVGTRGKGGFERLLLGSVSRAALHRPGCPVAVVRD